VTWWQWLLLGLLIGGVMGMVLMGLLVAASRRSEGLCLPRG
jgi:hypothetical protein